MAVMNTEDENVFLHFPLMYTIFHGYSAHIGTSTQICPERQKTSTFYILLSRLL
jgi:hypothetical protein